MPDLHDRFEEAGVLPSFWLTKWYMSIFLYNFPVGICLRIWDIFIKDGLFSLISFIFPIMAVFQ